MATDSNLVGVLIGAAVASVVPLVSLYQGAKRWKLEKKVENLRLKHSKLEQLYADVLGRLPEAMASNLYPSTLTAQISVHACAEVRKLFFDRLEKKDRDEATGKKTFLDISLAVHKHLAAVEKEIEDALA
jgi:hypothetical protein